MAGGWRGAVGMPVLGWMSHFPAPKEMKQGLVPERGLLEGFPRSLEARWQVAESRGCAPCPELAESAQPVCPLAAVHP